MGCFQNLPSVFTFCGLTLFSGKYDGVCVPSKCDKKTKKCPDIGTLMSGLCAGVCRHNGLCEYNGAIMIA